MLDGKTPSPRAASFAVLAILLASLLAPAALTASAALPDASRTAHLPIVIDGNEDLDRQAASEGWAGDGTATSPYLIRGYAIDAQGGEGITIAGTTKHIVVDRCEVYNATTGVLLSDLANVVIEATVVRGSADDGVRMADCKDVTVRDCRVTGSGGNGVELSSCDRVTVLGTILEDSTGFGVQAKGCDDCLFSGNSFLRNHGAGASRMEDRVQAYDDSFRDAWSKDGRGNHWSDWTSPDSDGDGIVDVLYGLDGIMMQDHYPLAKAALGLPAVTILSPQDGDTLPGPEVEVSWTALDDSGIAGCALEVDDDGPFAVEGASHTVVLGEGEHYLTVTATDALGLQGAASVRILVSRELPSAPTGLRAAAGDGAVELTWQPPRTMGTGPFAGYRVYQDGALIESTEQTGLRIDGLTNGREYEFGVTAVNAAGESLNATVVATPAAPPGAVPGLAAAVGPSTVTLSWGAPESGGLPVTSYQVLRDGEVVANVTARSFTDTALTNGVTYRYAVQAWSGAGWGQTAEVEATPLALPGEPALTVTVEGGMVRLTFSAAPFEGMAPVHHYVIYRGLAPDALTPLAETTDTWYNDTAVEDGKTYYYRVSAVSSVGESSLAAVRSATLRSDGTMLYLGAAAMAVGAAVLILLLYRRR